MTETEIGEVDGGERLAEAMDCKSRVEFLTNRSFQAIDAPRLRNHAVTLY